MSTTTSQAKTTNSLYTQRKDPKMTNNAPLTRQEAKDAIEHALSTTSSGRVHAYTLADRICRHDAVGRISSQDLQTFESVASQYLRDANGCYLMTEECAERDRRSAARARAWEQQRAREEAAGFTAASTEMAIGRVVWEYHTPSQIHTLEGADGHCPRWVRLLAARVWPNAGGIQTVRVRVMASALTPTHQPIGIQQILLDLSPELMGIDATEIGSCESCEI